MEIPVSVDGGEAEAAASLDKVAVADAEAGGAHPLGEIAGSAGHLLLLKLWQREEDRLGRRACALEARMDVARRDTFYLCAAFLALHSLALAVLFAASVGSAGSSIAAAAGDGGPESAGCRRWWAPSSLSLAASLALATAVPLQGPPPHPVRVPGLPPPRAPERTTLRACPGAAAVRVPEREPPPFARLNTSCRRPRMSAPSASHRPC